MSAAPKKIIVVVGGTGQLGSSVSLSLNANPEFHVRATSRNPSSEKAQALARKGVEVVKADNWKEAELLEAFKHCWGVFINLNSDLPNFKQKIGPSEFEMGKIIIDAAAKAGVKHVVHASLLPATKLTDGRVPVYSFDDKRACSEYAQNHGAFESVSLVNAGWFLENAFDEAYGSVFGGFATRKDAEGFYTWKCPRLGNEPELVPWLSVTDDYGDIVHGVFLQPDCWNGKVVHAVSESLSFADLTAAFTRATGIPARYIEVTDPDVADPNKKKEVLGLFALMHAVNGKFFDGEVTNHEDARVLKASVASIRGLSGKDSEPISVEQYWRKHSDRIRG